MAGNVNLLTNKDLRMTQEGRRFVANNPTPGTGIVGHAAATTWDQTKPFFYLANLAPVADPASPTLYPQMLRLMETTAGVGGTGAKFTFSLDVGDLYASGGSALTVVNTNPTFRNPPAQVRCMAGAVVCSAATASAQLIVNVTPRATVVDVIADQIEFNFGPSAGFTYASSGPESASAKTLYTSWLPAIAVPPGWCLKMVEWRASQSGAISAEFVADWFAFAGE